MGWSRSHTDDNLAHTTSWLYRLLSPRPRVWLAEFCPCGELSVSPDSVHCISPPYQGGEGPQAGLATYSGLSCSRNGTETGTYTSRPSEHSTCVPQVTKFVKKTKRSSGMNLPFLRAARSFSDQGNKLTCYGVLCPLMLGWVPSQMLFICFLPDSLWIRKVLLGLLSLSDACSLISFLPRVVVTWFP